MAGFLRFLGSQNIHNEVWDQGVVSSNLTAPTTFSSKHHMLHGFLWERVRLRHTSTQSVDGGPYIVLRENMFLPLHDDNPIEHIKFPYVNYALMGIMIFIFGVQSLLPADQFRSVVMAFGMVPGILGGELKDPLPWFPDGMS